MARQERAEQTRRRLIEAAAVEFAAHGFAGTSLLGIVRSAGVTMGALTFHFASKSALADAVQEAGAAATREVMHGEEAPSLQGVFGGALALAAALETTASIRAAARFTRERHDDTGPNWYASWAPQVREDLTRAWPEGDSGSGLTPGSASALLTYALAGFEATTSAPGGSAGPDGVSPRGELTQALAALSALATAVN